MTILVSFETVRSEVSVVRVTIAVVLHKRFDKAFAYQEPVGF